MKKTKMRGIPDAKLAEVLREHENVINQHTAVIKDLVAKVRELTVWANAVATPADEDGR